jgi:hypothetical protein
MKETLFTLTGQLRKHTRTEVQGRSDLHCEVWNRELRPQFDTRDLLHSKTDGNADKEIF